MELTLVLLLGTLSLVPYTDSHGEISESSKHCGMVSSADDLTEHYHCVQCLFPQNCLANNTCRTGTYGATCEKCVQGEKPGEGYYRVGNTCTKCLGVAWPAIALGVFVLFSIIATVINGFTDSVCTKLKLICHFVQYLLLTVHIKVAWPEILVSVIAIINFGGFNSNIIIPDCFFRKMKPVHIHYLEWLTSLSLLTLIFVFGKCLDNNMSSMSDSERSDWGTAAVRRLLGKHRKTIVRRFVFLVLVVMYTPVTISAFHTYLCSDSIPVELVLDHSKDIYLLDNDIPCGTFMFQTINFFATIFMLYVIGLPVLIVLLTLRQKKWDLLYSQWTLYGPAYESYKDFFCFGEAIHLLRKLISIVITEMYPSPPRTQIISQLAMSGIYLLLLVVLRPYRTTIDRAQFRKYLFWRYVQSNLGFNVISTAVICLVQTIALVINLDLYQPFLEYVAVIGIGVVIVLWILLLFMTSCERHDLDIMEEVVEEGERETEKKQKVEKKSNRGFWFWKSKKVGPDPEFLEKVAERKEHADF